MKTLSCGEARQIPIIEYLAKCGYQPQYIRGNNYWYLSPLHQESHASFKVNTRLNAWFDFGIGEGGNMIDLGIRLCKCSVKDFLPLLGSGYTHLFPDAKMIITFTSGAKSPVTKENHIKLLDVTALQNPGLINYINTRGINQPLAKAYCKEVRFAIAGKGYNAIGFANRSGGYELRNDWFKGSSSPKDITILKNDNGTQAVCVIEGFIDFLSLLELKQLRRSETDVIILNSVALIGRSIEILKSYKDIFLFLNHDKAGRTAAEKLRQAGIKGIDASEFYKGYNDVNEYLDAQQRIALQAQIRCEAPEERGLGIER
ncbi:toprim domain-containing protein [Mucilaginibacter lappiensis]|uniref:5S rRNA maturation endonuclease (Ribonuclease M5) n=1 Tax=Mucilaginibacter lappiensis TaxID=354630 RepID=A0A841JN11_9SPHI|nr:toprim domain-containing protein [Mucilaginibacter lappiensis]MBB6131662.1 5S rRNA maturation endonuclease (ribonuclease M5) [Mucilaginibacter lappiensis]